MQVLQHKEMIVVYGHYGIMFSVYGVIGNFLLCLLISFYLLKQLDSL